MKIFRTPPGGVGNVGLVTPPVPPTGGSARPPQQPKRSSILKPVIDGAAGFMNRQHPLVLIPVMGTSEFMGLGPLVNHLGNHLEHAIKDVGIHPIPWRDFENGVAVAAASTLMGGMLFGSSVVPEQFREWIEEVTAPIPWAIDHLGLARVIYGKDVSQLTFAEVRELVIDNAPASKRDELATTWGRLNSLGEATQQLGLVGSIVPVISAQYQTVLAENRFLGRYTAADMRIWGNEILMNAAFYPVIATALGFGNIWQMAVPAVAMSSLATAGTARMTKAWAPEGAFNQIAVGRAAVFSTMNVFTTLAASGVVSSSWAYTIQSLLILSMVLGIFFFIRPETPDLTDGVTIDADFEVKD